ncbi:alpha-ketoglutarate-dependent dioxygenase AlkB [Propionibacteriaceae bacterium Y1685]|uniref:alpha-ketoglutarate-dependent dioxygenase AlkB n=1 Tax=Microlunatus sp. Y1700 TaxID=3418487 RepID=UPI003B7C6C3A
MELQGSLLEVGSEGLEPYSHGLHREELGRGAWLDLRPAWLTGGDLMTRLIEDVPWQAERRAMYDRVVDVPRLVHFYAEADRLPHPLLREAHQALNTHYADELGEPFVTAGCCYYRDGRDSVAWHGDTIGRSRHEDTMVVICSFGADRKLMVRPRGGGAARGFVLGHGDVLVMGGSTQRTMEHAVPKTSRPVGPRISVQFRVAGVR